MRFDKQQILSMISDPSQAEQAEQQLPDTLDHEEHGHLLQQFGVDPNQLGGSSGGQAAGADQDQFQQSGSGHGGEESGSGYGGATDEPQMGDEGQTGSGAF